MIEQATWGLIDQLILSAFLLIVLYTGISNINKIENVNVFAVGRRSFSTWALFFTVTGTWISGSSFFITLSNTYYNGLAYYLPSMGMIVCLIFIATCIAPYMNNFLGKTSVAAVMGEHYGETVRSITAVCGFIGVSGTVAIQFKVLGEIGHTFFDISSNWSVMLMGGLVIIYTVFGGVQSVVKTDIIQCITFLVALPLVGVIFAKTFMVTDGTDVFDETKFNIIKLFYSPDTNWNEIALLSLYFAIPSLSATDFQRLTMGLNSRQGRNAYLGAALAFFIIKIIMVCFPLALYKIAPDISKGHLLEYILNHFTTPFLKSILAIGIIAMCMSTADSMLNIGAVLIANDFWILKKYSDDRKLSIAQYSVFGLGILSIILALSNDNLLFLKIYAASFYTPLVTIPLICIIWKLKITGRSVLITMGFSFAYVLVFKIILNSHFNIIPYAMLLNAIVLISSHYIVEKWELLKFIGIRSHLKTK